MCVVCVYMCVLCGCVFVCMHVCVHVGVCACEDQKTASVAPLGTSQSCFCLSFQIESLTDQELF